MRAEEKKNAKNSPRTPGSPRSALSGALSSRGGWSSKTPRGDEEMSKRQREKVL